MQAPDFASLERIEDRLARLPGRLELDGSSADEFRRRRARIHQRHNEWRRGMPAIDELFDNDEHRAKALAGSLATELERILELYGELALDLESGLDWPRRFAAEWDAGATRIAACWGWSDEANATFRAVLDDLSARAVRRAEAGERPRSERVEVQVSRLRRLGIMGARTVKRFFRPPPAGR